MSVWEGGCAYLGNCLPGCMQILFPNICFYAPVVAERTLEHSEFKQIGSCSLTKVAPPNVMKLKHCCLFPQNTDQVYICKLGCHF